MTRSEDNRFQEFFGDDRYVGLKNHLYNYLLRRKAVGKALQGEKQFRVLEVGSGLSPVTDTGRQVIYSDLSLLALRTLKLSHGGGGHVVANAESLPFRTGTFSQVVASEVLEHLPDDQMAITEMVRVMSPLGCLVITFPQGRRYFASDDRFVRHYRRYDLGDMLALLENAGLRPILIRKVLGPLEKVTMCIAVAFFSILQKRRSTGHNARGTPTPPGFATILYKWLFKWCNRAFTHVARLDAFIAPRFLSMVMLIKAVRKADYKDQS
jgi:ubiquinone/menaquinone biosynthesis C-methylase UbiE